MFKQHGTLSQKYRRLTNSLLGSAKQIDPYELTATLLGEHLHSDTYTEFQQRYYHDPAAFIQDCIVFPPGKGAADYQLQAAADLIKHGRLSIRAPHSAGKTSLASWIIHWFALTRDGRTDWKAPLTASVWRQLTKFLLPEVHKWARLLDWVNIGREPYGKQELLQQGLKMETGEAFAIASNNPALIEGAHATSLLYVFDESKTIQGATFDAAEGAFATAGSDTYAEAYGLTLSTPGAPIGRFYDIQAQKPQYRDWKAVSITMEAAVAAGRMSREWVDARRRQWGEDSPIYITRVLGNFAADSENATIPLAWIEAAVDRWHEWQALGFPGQVRRLGVDVARYGADRTYIADYVDSRQHPLDQSYFGIRGLEVFAKLDTMQVAGKVRARLDRIADAGDTAVIASVDTVGLGAGVFDRLRELGYPVYDYKAGRKTKQRDLTKVRYFDNVRSYSFWHLRELLDPGNGFMFCLPPHDELQGDLAVHVHNETSDGLVQVEQKEQLKKRIGRSPDAGDSVAIAMFDPPMRKRRIGVHV